MTVEGWCDRVGRDWEEWHIKSLREFGGRGEGAGKGTRRPEEVEQRGG